MAEDVIIVDDTNFEKEVKQSKLLVIVDCYADWCGPCKLFGPVFESVAVNYKGKAKFCKLNVDNAGEVVGSLGVFSVPTTLFLKNGEEVDRVTGALDEYRFKQKIDQVLK